MKIIASDRRINTNNIFLIDRLGLEDSLERKIINDSLSIEI